MEVAEREIIYLSLYCHHQNDFCIKVGSDESRFNVSLTVRGKVTRQCPQTTTFEEKGEPKRIRTDVPPLTSLTPYRWAKPAHLSPVNQSLEFGSSHGYQECGLAQWSERPTRDPQVSGSSPGWSSGRIFRFLQCQFSVLIDSYFGILSITCVTSHSS